LVVVVVRGVVVGTAVLAGGAGCGWGGDSPGEVNIQGGRGNGTRLVSGSGEVLVTGCASCPHATVPNSAAMAATPAVRRAIVLSTEPAPFLITRREETLCDRADAIR
jgi:hypothetical protein